MTRPGRIYQTGRAANMAPAHIRIVFNETQKRFAVALGEMRAANVHAKGYSADTRGTHDVGRDAEYHVRGALAEMAYAMYSGQHETWQLGVFDRPTSAGVDITPDVGHEHVRTTKHQGGHLILRDWDPGDYVYVFTTSECPMYGPWAVHLVGWVWGAHFMRPEFSKALERARKEAFCVGQQYMMPMPVRYPGGALLVAEEYAELTAVADAKNAATLPPARVSA